MALTGRARIESATTAIAAKQRALSATHAVVRSASSKRFVLPAESTYYSHGVSSRVAAPTADDGGGGDAGAAGAAAQDEKLKQPKQPPTLAAACGQIMDPPVRCTIVMPEDTPRAKQERARAYGADAYARSCSKIAAVAFLSTMRSHAATCNAVLCKPSSRAR